MSRGDGPGPVTTGVVAALVAAGATALLAGLARAGGVALEVPDGGEPIPLSGVAFVTGVLSLVGVGLAIALRRWSARPAARFVATTLALTAISLVPPFVVGASAGTATTLAALHLVAAAIVVPALARSLRRAEAPQGVASRSTASMKAS